MSPNLGLILVFIVLRRVHRHSEIQIHMFIHVQTKCELYILHTNTASQLELFREFSEANLACIGYSYEAFRSCYCIENIFVIGIRYLPSWSAYCMSTNILDWVMLSGMYWPYALCITQPAGATPSRSRTASRMKCA